jgi:hypothetical protein
MNFQHGYIDLNRIALRDFSGLEPHERHEAHRLALAAAAAIHEDSPAPATAPVATPDPDLISATAAAAKYPVTRRWIIANRRKYSFIKVVTHKNTQVSERGLQRWLDKR